MAKTLQRLFFASITKHTVPVERGMQVPPPHISPGIEVKPVSVRPKFGIGIGKRNQG